MRYTSNPTIKMKNIDKIFLLATVLGYVLVYGIIALIA